MRIVNTGAASQSSSVKKSKKSQKSDGSFGNLLSSQISDTSSVPSGSEAISPISGLLALQVVNDEPPQQQHLEHGKKLLDFLDELRHDFLIGRVTAESANRIIQEIKSTRNEITDPRLKEIIADIELRANVELAKLTR